MSIPIQVTRSYARNPLAALGKLTVAALVGPTIQRYLQGDLPVPTTEEQR